MHLVDMHCYRRTLGIYCHMALDPEGAAQPPTVWRSTSNYIVYELETDTSLKGIGEISDFRDNIGQLDPPQLRRTVPVPLIEHVGDFSDKFALALVRHRAVDVFNIIPVQTGSLHRAQRLVHLAAQAGIQAMLGSTIELGPGLAASLHLALASAALCVPSDLVNPGFLVDDVVEPQFKCRNGTLSVPQAPGLGIRLEAQKLQIYRLSSG